MDHVHQYRRPKDEDGNEIIEKGCAPKTPTSSPTPSPEPELSPPRTKKSKLKEKVIMVFVNNYSLHVKQKQHIFSPGSTL